jgi:hypothetical protein
MLRVTPLRFADLPPEAMASARDAILQLIQRHAMVIGRLGPRRLKQQLLPTCQQNTLPADYEIRAGILTREGWEKIFLALRLTLLSY